MKITKKLIFKKIDIYDKYIHISQYGLLVCFDMYKYIYIYIYIYMNNTIFVNISKINTTEWFAKLIENLGKTFFRREVERTAHSQGDN